MTNVSRTIAHGTAMRARILDVAGDLFAANGYASTSIRDIAKAVGISNPALYHHFTGKQDILLALLAGPVQLMTELIAHVHSLPAPQRPHAFFDGFYTALSQQQGAQAIGLLSDLHTIENTGPESGARRIREQLTDVLAEAVGGPHARVRAAMALAAFTAAVEATARTSQPDTFAANLATIRDTMTTAALATLRSPTAPPVRAD